MKFDVACHKSRVALSGILLIVALSLPSCIPTPPAPDNLPEAIFGASPLEGPAPLRVRFNNNSITHGEALLSLAWTFGDGDTSADAAPEHTYTAPGKYTVTLRVATAIGEDSQTRVDYITVREDTTPEEGEVEGTVEEGEGVSEGEPIEGEPAEGATEGTVDGEPTEGEPEAEPEGEGEGEGSGEGEGEGSTEGEGEGGGELQAGEVRQFLGMDFVWIPPGEFEMGTNRTPAELELEFGDREFFFRSEQPAHRVRITRGFWLGRTELTQEEWLRFRTENPSQNIGSSRPVDTVSWNAAQSLVEELSTLGGGHFRLPTEAEWEYACRAETTTEFSFGNNTLELDDYGWYFDNALFATQNVARLRANPWGLFDIHGNVFEWCADWYAQGYYAESPLDDPQGPADTGLKVRRGGSYTRTQAFCRSSFRLWNGPDDQLDNTGLRLLREADE